MNQIRPALQIIPVAYLFTATATQLYFLNYCFGSRIEPFSLAVIFGSLALFSAAYLVAFNRPPGSPRNQLKSSTLTLVAFILLAASALYILIATVRVIDRWDAFAQGPTSARAVLMGTRTGVTALGFLNSVFLGAPAVFAVFVTAYGGQLRYGRLLKAAAVLTFGAFTYLMAIEGGRSPFMISIGFLVTVVAFRLLHGGKIKDIGVGFLVGMALVSAAAFSFSYKEIENREALLERNTAAQVQSNYSGYVNNAVTSRTENAKEHLSASAAVSCFYFSHPPRSIDRIVSKGADENLFGFYMMPNYYKLAQLLGLANKDWIFYSDYYEINGMYSGLLGALLIDFSWIGILLMAAIGYICGRLVAPALDGSFDRSPYTIATAIVPMLVFLIPVVDLTSTALMQSMLPWIALTILPMWLSTRSANPKLSQLNAAGWLR